jgi:diguanylate cyclase (GGDEF)-like protein
VGTEWDEDTSTAIEVADFLGQLTPAKKPCVTVLTGTASGQVFNLPVGNTVVGRAANAEIRLQDDGVSRHHARLRVEGGEVWVDDLESRNGTFVNAQKITEPVQLADGDKIQIGRSIVLRFGYQDELDASYHESLISSSLRDPLTQLFNRRYLLDRLDSELKFARRHQTTISLLLLDLDHFKRLNDSHGHLAGDAVLVNLAAALTHAVRDEDVVARFGGEEIAIILRAIPLERAVQLAERLRKLIESTITDHNGVELRTTASIGAATFPNTPAERVEDLIEAADRALYKSKDKGRNRVSRPTTLT